MTVWATNAAPQTTAESQSEVVSCSHKHAEAYRTRGPLLTLLREMD